MCHSFGMLSQKDTLLRYKAGMNNLSKLYLPICDYWLIIDNSEPPFQIIAEGFKTENVEIIDHIIYNKIVKL